MTFEEKKFVRIGTLAERWDCSTDRIYDLLRRQRLRAWHPEREVGRKGLMIEVASILHVEASGYVDLTSTGADSSER